MTLAEMKQRYNVVAKEMRGLNDKIGDKGWNDEQRTSWDGMKSELDGLRSKIEREEELRDAEQRFAEEKEAEQRQRVEGEQRGTQPGSKDEKRAAAFDSWMRRGMGDSLSDEHRSILREMRAQATNPGEAGGYTVPTQFLNRITESMKDYGGIASVAQLLTTDNGQPIQWPTSDGTGDIGELIGENQQTGEQDVSFGMDDLGAHKLSSKVIRVSNELLQDSGVDLEGFLASRIGSRLGRAEAHYLIKGTGEGSPKQPKGLEASVTGIVTTAAADKLTWQEANSLIHSIDPAYRRAVGFRLAFNDNTLKQFEEMVDGQGRPLWLPGIIGGAEATVLGRKYVIDQGINDIGADSKFMFAGDFQQLVLRRVRYMVLKRLTERYAENDQTGFLAFSRFGCVLQDTAAIKALVGKGGGK